MVNNVILFHGVFLMLDGHFSQMDLTLVTTLNGNQSLCKPFYNDQMKKENLSDRIKRLRERLGMSQSDLSKSVGVSSVSVSKWEGGRDPNSKWIKPLARALRCSEEELLHGKGLPSNLQTIPVVRIPIVNWKEAANWLDEEKREEILSKEKLITHDVTEDFGPDAFGLVVYGDSMSSATSRTVPEGAIAIVSPGAKPEHGNIIIAVTPNNDTAIMRMLVVEAGSRYLKALNPAYPLLPLHDDSKIIGVVKAAKMTF